MARALRGELLGVWREPPPGLEESTTRADSSSRPPGSSLQPLHTALPSANDANEEPLAASTSSTTSTSMAWQVCTSAQVVNEGELLCPAYDGQNIGEDSRPPGPELHDDRDVSAEGVHEIL